VHVLLPPNHINKLTMKNENLQQNLRNRIAGITMALAMCFGTAAQQSYTFTTAGATGQFGPTQGMVNTAYNLTNLSGSVSVIGQGVQQWTVPVTGAYSIRAIGASGRGTTINCTNTGGLGADMYGEFNLTAGQVILILVGQEGVNAVNGSSQDGGGGGGSFVTTSASVALVVAGAGGGSTNNISNCTGTQRDGLNASLTTSGTNGANGNGAGGTSGNGGTGTGGGGGGGFIGNGIASSVNYAGKSFMNGGAGGIYGGAGGFGGGGAGFSIGGNGGGGGGYSGGGTASGSPYAGGGGGGSYNSGTNQNNVLASGSGDGRVIISRLCDVVITASKNPICFGESVVLTTNAGSNILWNTLQTTQSITVTPTTSTTYTVSGVSSSSSACSSTVTFNVLVNPLPTIAVGTLPQVMCVGGTATVFATGAVSYTWSNQQSSSSTTVTPAVTSVYTVTGENSLGCTKSETVQVVVNTNSVTVTPPTSVCAGSAVNLTASGITTFSWSTGSFFSTAIVTPSANTNYSVQGYDNYGCVISGTTAVTVHSNPTVTVSADRISLCRGESVTLSAGGANSFQWNTGDTGGSVTYTLPLDVPYTYVVSGTTDGCTRNATITVQVSKCTGIIAYAQSTLKLYPNPTKGTVTVDLLNTGEKALALTDISGRVVIKTVTSERTHTIDLGNAEPGIYFLKVTEPGSISTIRIIKE
jgi:hypothetical protein